MSMYSDALVKGILGEINKVRKADALSATVIMIYVAIDTMAYLSMPEDAKMNGSDDFIRWVNDYLKTDASQSYQYDGKDMWGARCGKLHAYSSNSEYAKKNKCKQYGYHNGSEHMYEPQESENLVLISIDRLINDFAGALSSFLTEAAKKPDLKKLIDMRIEQVFQQFDISKEE